MNEPKISVVMTVYNSEKFLDQAVQSILNQTFSDFEFIIINDGSSDRSSDILNKYAKEDNRIIIYSRQNSGVAASANFAIQKAKAGVIARMDSDDISELNRFQKQFLYLEENPECVAVGSKVIIIDPNGLPIANDWFEQLTHEEIDSTNMTGKMGSTICNPSVMFRKSAFEAVGGYRENFQSYAEDYDLFLRLAEYGRLANLSDFLLKYRVHPNSVGHSKKQLQLLASKQILEDAYQRRGIKDIPQSVLQLNQAEEEAEKSELDMYQTWGWLALQNQYIKTARQYALKLLFKRPLSISSWKFLYAVLRGH